jgi:hypothetical protein
MIALGRPIECPIALSLLCRITNRREVFRLTGARTAMPIAQSFFSLGTRISSVSSSAPLVTCPPDPIVRGLL